MSFNYQSFKTLHLIMLLSVANFLAAFAHGAILHYYPSEFFKTQNNGIIDTFNNPLLALVGGGILGLAFIKLMPPRWSQRASGWASIAAGVMSLLLFWFFSSHILCKESPSYIRDFHDWLFFPLICMRFGLSFAARSFRLDVAARPGLDVAAAPGLDAAAAPERKIGWVELAYSTGLVLGLIPWIHFIPWIDFNQDSLQIFKIILCMDFALLLTAGVLDLFSSPSFFNQGVKKTPAEERSRPIWHNSARYKAAVVIAVALTVGVQMVAFAFSSNAGEQKSSMLAGFYFGAAVASLIYGSYVEVKLRWPRRLQKGKYFRIPVIIFGGRPRRRYSLALACVLSITAPLVAILVGRRLTLSLFIILPLIGVAAFLLEMILLSLFKWVGDEAAKTHQKGLVAVMMGAMGVGGTISLYCLSIPWSYQYAGWLGTSVGCLVVAILTVPVATLLSRPSPDGPGEKPEAAGVLSLSSRSMQSTAPAGEAAAASGDA